MLVMTYGVLFANVFHMVSLWFLLLTHNKPKVEDPSSFKDFRPISLCNALYKLVTKMLVNRFRPFLNDMISPLESMFTTCISRRGEKMILFLSWISKRPMTGWIEIFWGTLSSCLGSPPVITSLVMHGISSTSISLLWNGSVTPSFTPRRGLRQGDPLSPYLFVLCMEILGDLISQEVQRNKWQPLSVTKGGPKISHLFFCWWCSSLH